MAKAVRFVGIVVAIAAVTFCVHTLVDQWSTISPSVQNASVSWLVVAFVAGGLSMAVLGLLWWRCLAAFGERRTLGEAVAWYFGGELGKYLPGGIWQVLGRGELAARAGVSRSVGYATTLISYGSMCVAAGLVCGFLAPMAAAQGGRLGWGWVLAPLIPLSLLVVHPAVFQRILALGSRVTKGRLDLTPRPWAQMLALIAVAVPTWLLLGGSSVAIAHALGYDGQFARIAFAAVAAWIVGFLAVPVPAGAGLREVVFIALSGLAVGEATAVAAISRGLLIAVDGLGGILGLWYAQSRPHDSADRSGADMRGPHDEQG